MAFDIYRYIYHYNIGSSELPYAPVMLWVEPTNRCNLKCTMCPNSISGKSREPGFMDMELFEKIVREAAGWTKTIYLFLAGESLMHRQLPEMAALAEKNGIRVVLHTNGCLMTRENSEKLVRSGLSEISFSFDAISPEEYNQRRAGANYEKTLAAIKQFLEIRRELKSQKPKVTIQCIDFSGKAGKAGKKRMQELFHGAGPVNINIIAPHTWAGTFKEDGSLAAPGICGEYFQCKFPWTSMAIAWNGDVLACCNDIFGEIHLGSVREKSLRELWNSKEMQRFRQALVAGRFTDYPLCKECDIPYNHNNARAPVKWARTLENRKLAGTLSLGIELGRRAAAKIKSGLKSGSES